MTELRFTKDHEWVRLDGEIAVVGITDHAQQQLGDIVFVELPAVGRSLTQGGDAAVVESVKAASEVYAPLTGTVTEVNPALADDPSLVNASAEDGGWFFKIKPSNPAELSGLMDRAAYEALVGGGH